MNQENGLQFSPELQKLLNRLPGPVAVVDENRRVLWKNGGMTAYRRERRLTGRTDTICAALGCLHSGDDSEGCGSQQPCRRCGLDILVKNTLRVQQQDASTRFRLALSEKTHRLLELSVTYVVRKGTPAVILTFSDETELRSRKHLLAEIKRLTDALQAAGSTCHELAQPLMTISGYIQLLLMDTERGSTRYARLEKINEQALRISAITREVMSIRQRHLSPDDQASTRHRHLTLI